MLFGSESTINFPAMADAQQVDDVSFRIEGIDDPIISHPQPALRSGSDLVPVYQSRSS